MKREQKPWEGRERLYAYNQMNKLMKRELSGEKRPQARRDASEAWVARALALAPIPVSIPKKRAEDAPCKGHETAWLAGLWKPAYPGIYQRKLVMEGRSWLWAYWDGDEWMVGAATPEDALRQKAASKHQYAQWRGCAIPPGPEGARAPRRRKAHQEARG